MSVIGLQLLNSPGSPLAYFVFHDAPNVFTGKSVQYPDSSITTMVVIYRRYFTQYCPAEIYKALPENDVHFIGTNVALKPIYTFQHWWCLFRCASCQFHQH